MISWARSRSAPFETSGKFLRRRNNNFNWTKVFVEWTHLRSLYFFLCLFLSLVFRPFHPILFTPRFTWMVLISSPSLLLLLRLLRLYSVNITMFVYVLFDGGKLCVHHFFRFVYNLRMCESTYFMPFHIYFTFVRFFLSRKWCVMCLCAQN